MFTLFETQPEFKRLSDLLKELTVRLLDDIEVLNETSLIPSNKNIADSDEYKNLFFLIKEGSLSYRINDKVLYVCEEGDLVGLESAAGASISSDFAVRVQAYEHLQILGNPRKIPLFHEYISVKNDLFNSIIYSLLKSEVALTPQLINYKQGDVIINQNETADGVYTLVEGKAEAFVDGVKVGDITRDEIFGMIAAITNTPRTATVIAASNCVALSVPNNKFLDLINNKPQTVLKLLEDMSKLIIELNKKVVGLNNYKY